MPPVLCAGAAKRNQDHRPASVLEGAVGDDFHHRQWMHPRAAQADLTSRPRYPTPAYWANVGARQRRGSSVRSRRP